MSKESYIRGFCKAAEAHGVDPVRLAKFAAAKRLFSLADFPPEKAQSKPDASMAHLLGL